VHAFEIEISDITYAVVIRTPAVRYAQIKLAEVKLWVGIKITHSRPDTKNGRGRNLSKNAKFNSSQKAKNVVE
jgi:hypothetical protein